MEWRWHRRRVTSCRRWVTLGDTARLQGTEGAVAGAGDAGWHRPGTGTRLRAAPRPRSPVASPIQATDAAGPA